MEINQSHFRSLRSLFFLIVFFATAGVILQWRLLFWFQYTSMTSLTSQMFEISEPLNERTRISLGGRNEVKARCKLASPPLYSHDAMPFLEKSFTPANCILPDSKSKKLTRSLLYRVKNGRFLHRLEDPGPEVSCCVRRIERVEDDDDLINVSSECIPVTQEVTEINTSMEYISVECKDRDSKDLVYSESFLLVHPKSNPKKVSASVPKLNFIMIGMDATSRLNFIRKMPLTYNYLVANLSATVLKGQNKVGECTHTNLIPLLTGLPIQKFYQSCVDPQLETRGDVKLDNCSLMWTKFEEKGYVTFFAEDYSRWGPLNFYFPNTFQKPPTHYYLRPAIRYADTNDEYYNQMDFSCIGPRLGFPVLLDNLKMVAELNINKPLFQLIWPGSLGYRDMNFQQRGDEALYQALKYLHMTNELNKTALFIVGDHGFRKKGYKYTRVGAIEDRMPVGIVVLPDWFQTSFPEQYANLRENSFKMTSHFDLHRTMIDILNIGEKGNEEYHPGEPGISLFKTIPDDRTCLAAGIPLLWCLPCYPRQPLEENIKIEVANFLIDTLNTGWQYCDPRIFKNQGYTIKGILFGSKWDPRDVYREICSPDGRPQLLRGYYGQNPTEVVIPCEIPQNKEDLVEIITVEFATEATNATFHGEVIRYRNRYNGKWHLQLTEDIQFNWKFV